MQYYYLCPECGSPNVMVSDNGDVQCTDCGYFCTISDCLTV